MNNSKPIVVVSCDINSNERIELRQEYTLAISKAGGIPVIMPPMTEESAIQEWLRTIDPKGILLSGGCDIDPIIYGDKPMPFNGRVNTQRDTYELLLTKVAIENRLPILGVCRGLQVINVFFGGTLVQDMEAELGIAKVKHDQTENSSIGTHKINVKPDTLTYTLLNKEIMLTNSHHHQCIKKLGRELEITAKSDDGIIEAIENYDKKIIGLQFHPERMQEFDGFFKKWLYFVSYKTQKKE